MEREVVIGSDRSCDLPVAFDAVSSRHFRVISDNGELWVEDRDSTNGTYIDGQCLKPGSQQRLGPSSELDLGGEVTFTADEIRDLQSLNATETGRKRPGRRNRSERNQEVEYVPSSGYAGFWRRVFASLIDGVLLAILGATVGAIIGAVIGTSGGRQRRRSWQIKLLVCSPDGSTWQGSSRRTTRQPLGNWHLESRCRTWKRGPSGLGGPLGGILERSSRPWSYSSGSS